MANHDDGVRPVWQPYTARSLMADEIREFRAILGLTQAGLAGALGVSLRAVEEWEGRRNPAPTYLQLALERLATLKALADDHTRREVEAGRVDPTKEEAAGMAWWNGLTVKNRAAWMKRAGDTGVIADAWAAAKALGGAGANRGLP